MSGNAESFFFFFLIGKPNGSSTQDLTLYLEFIGGEVPTEL